MAHTAGSPAPLTFLMHDAYGGDGVVRAVNNIANQLIRHREVRVISLHRRSGRPRFDWDPRIEIRALRYSLGRPGRSSVLGRYPSLLRPQPAEPRMSLQTDYLLLRALRGVREGIIISTRPALHLATTQFARSGVRTVGWDHLNFLARAKHTRQLEVLRKAVPKLDGYVMLTEADRHDYQRDLGPIDTELAVIRNAVSWELDPRPADPENKVIIAAGRMVARKAFGRMIKGFAPVARTHPDWQLHIYGRGVRHDPLLQIVSDLGLESQVMLKGYTRDVQEAFRSASICAMSSTSEGFPMVLIEAMHVGLPLIAFDCPRGPGEAIVHGRNGLLIPEGPVEAFTDGLRTLVEDVELRRRMGGFALEDAQQYTVEKISGDWELFLDRVAARR
ncbi:MAG: glycosyltransferase family 4 protein [Actinomycetota bacterium]|nr:glycosyltransferase family 4 protein [Actinomycetota bacterium]